MRNNLEIRILTESDFESFWNMRLRALKEEPTSYGSSYEEAIAAPQSEALKRLEESEHSFIVGAFNPHLVGIVGFFRERSIKKNHKGIIWGVYVAPEARGSGVARSLMEAAIARAKTIPNVERLQLSVMSQNQSARRLYASLGFEHYGTEINALKVNDRFHPEDLMALKLAREETDKQI